MTYELYHHGILGQRWGIRRFQNKDGSLTEAGKKRNLQLHETTEKYLYQKRDSPGLKKAAKATLERGRLRGKSDQETIFETQERAVEKMEAYADLAKTIMDINPSINDPDFQHAYKTIVTQRNAANRGYMYLSEEMSRQAGLFNKRLSNTDLKRAEDLGRRWEAAYDGTMSEFDTRYLPSEMKEKFDF